MASITVVTQIEIDRPIVEVRGQFGDIRHHVDHNVHDDIVLEVISADADGYDFYLTNTVFGRQRRNKLRLSRQGDGSVLVRYLEGPDAGTVNLSTFEDIGNSRTRVIQSNTVPLRGVMTLAAWLVRSEVRRQSNHALEQDRADLETRGYPAAS